jgi:hypothetical protein
MSDVGLLLFYNETTMRRVRNRQKRAFLRRHRPTKVSAPFVVYFAECSGDNCFVVGSAVCDSILQADYYHAVAFAEVAKNVAWAAHNKSWLCYFKDYRQFDRPLPLSSFGYSSTGLKHIQNEPIAESQREPVFVVLLEE